MYKIEKDLEMPKNYNGKYPFADMQIGDAFRVPTEDKINKRSIQKRISVAAISFCKKNIGKKFSTRTGDNEILVFRVK